MGEAFWDKVITLDTTFWAAVVAAVVSLFNLFLSNRAKRSSEMRTAYRKLLSPRICDLGEALHQELASIKMLLKRANEGVGKGSWEERGRTACAEIEKLRRQLRYPLWGIDKGLQRLGRLLNWSQHLQVVPREADKLFLAGDKLKTSIDRALLYSFTHGKPPSLWHIFIVKYRSWKVASIYQKAMNKPIDEEQSEE